jgi:type IV secretion system protein VirD4
MPVTSVHFIGREMTKRLVIVFSLLDMLLMGAALVGSTQYVARKLSYDPGLGPPATTLASGPIYEPWAWFEWDERFHRYAPGVFGAATLITCGALVVSVASLLGLAFLKGRGRGGSTSHPRGGSCAIP